MLHLFDKLKIWHLTTFYTQTWKNKQQILHSWLQTMMIFSGKEKSWNTCWHNNVIYKMRPRITVWINKNKIEIILKKTKNWKKKNNWGVIIWISTKKKQRKQEQEKKKILCQTQPITTFSNNSNHIHKNEKN